MFVFLVEVDVSERRGPDRRGSCAEQFRIVSEFVRNMPELFWNCLVRPSVRPSVRLLPLKGYIGPRKEI